MGDNNAPGAGHLWAPGAWLVGFIKKTTIHCYTQKGTSRQRSGKGAIRERFPLQKPRWEKTKVTIRYLYRKTFRKPNEQLFSQ